MVRLTAWGLVALVATVSGTRSGGALAAQAAPPRALDAATSKRVAESIVTKNARVRPGELVYINGGESDMPLLEDLAVEIRKAGAYSIIDYGSNRLERRLYDEVPAALDTMGPQLRTLPLIDVFIGTDYVDPGTLDGVDPARRAARNKAGAPAREAFKSWKGRSVALGNGLYPTPGNARQAGITTAQLGSLYRAGLDVDYDAIQRTAEALRGALAHGKEIHLTAANGTDLRAQIGGRTPYTSDGVISDADRSGGIAQRVVYLPAGEVYVVTAPGSAAGTLVMDQYWYQNKPVTALRVEVKAGKVQGISARRGAEQLRTDYENAGAGKDQVGVLDIGINPAIHAPAGSRLQPWSQAGVVTLAVGNNFWAGGDNNGGFMLPIQLAGATLTVDGTTLVDHGKLIVPDEAATR